MVQPIIEFSHGLTVSVSECFPDQSACIAIHGVAPYRNVRSLGIRHNILFRRTLELISLSVHFEVKLSLSLIFNHTLRWNAVVSGRQHSGGAD